MGRRKIQVTITLMPDVLEMLDKAVPRTNAKSRSELVEILLRQTLPKFQEGAVWNMARPPNAEEMFSYFQELERRVEALEKKQTEAEK